MAEKTKEQIIEITDALFSKSGVRDVSIDDICRRLCISKKTFYQLYPQKEDLVCDVLERRIETRRKEFDGLSQQKTFIQTLKILFDRIAKKRMMVPDKKISSEIRKYYPETFEKTSVIRLNVVRECLMNIFNKGVKEGAVRPEMNDDSFMLLIYLMHNGMIRYFEDNSAGKVKKIPFRTLLKSFEDIVTRTLLTDNGFQEYSTMIIDKKQNKTTKR